MRHRSSDGATAVSRQAYARLFYEFQSLAAHDNNAMQFEEVLGKQAITESPVFPWRRRAGPPR